MSSNLYIDVKVYGGAHIEKTAEQMVDLASKLGISVWASFNGVRILARPSDSPANIVKSFHEKLSSDCEYKIAKDTR